MADYPTLSRNPSYPLTDDAEDPAIKSDFEAGYTQTRARFTRTRRVFEVGYKAMTNADKLLLEAFADTVKGGVDSFAWTHPITSVSYTVRFDKRPKFQAVDYGDDGTIWETSFTLVQV